MPTNNKTPNLNLNAWLGTDKPMRIDFVEDNQKIDNIVGSHINNSLLHLTTAQILKINEPFVIEDFGGTGSAEYNISLPFTPSLVIIYMRGKPFVKYDSTNGYNLVNAAIAGTYMGVSVNSAGITLNGSTIKFYQTQTSAVDGVFLNLNKSGGQYTIVSFR
jgi:hypothetical protein